MVSSNSNLIRMMSTIEIMGRWPEGSGNIDIAYQKPLGLRLKQMTNGWWKSEVDDAQFKLMWAPTSFEGGGL